MNPKTNNFLLATLLGVTLIVGLMGLFTAVLPPVTHAAGPWYVDAAAGDDGNDCLSAVTACKTVNAAVGKASAGDTVNIAAGTYVENLSLSQNITLIGAGADSVTLDGGGGGRVIFVGSGVTVTLSGLTAQNGSASEGAGIYNAGTVLLSQSRIISNSASWLGGGIFNSNGIMTVTNSAISDNQSANTTGGLFNSGGQVWLENVTVSGNMAFGATDDGVHNQGSGVIDLTNVTVSGNTGYGILSTSSATITVQNSAIANNGSFGIVNYAAINIKNSIVADNNGGGGNCGGTDPVTSQGYNLDDGSSCNFSGTGDLSNQDPQLLPLADYGGDTKTHALSSGSPAIDAGTNMGCPATDQRGQARPVDGDNDSTATCDMGPFEFAFTPLSGVTISGDATGFANSAYAFQATAVPVTATRPITYTWQATDQTPVTHAGGGITDTVTFNWPITGTKTITVTADNGVNQLVDTHQITVNAGIQAIVSLTFSGPTSGSTGRTYRFDAGVLPTTATLPITYTWQTDGEAPIVRAGQGVTDTMSFNWSDEGVHVVSVTATNIAGSKNESRTIVLSDWYVDGDNGNDSNGCQSAANACKTIAGAMGKATDGNTIRIAAGAYSENLSFSKSLTLIGAGAGQTIIDGGGGGRVISINGGVTVVLDNLTARDGSAAEGAGVYNAGTLTLSQVEVASNVASWLGGGIYNSGTLTATNSAVSGNQSDSSTGGLFNSGGQVWLENVTISGNSASGSNDDGIHNQGSGAIDLTNVTVSGNTGYGILNTASSTITVQSSTIANNGSFGIANYAAISVKNSIVADNNSGGDNCSGSITSQGYNLDSGNSCGWSGSGDLTNSDPRLRPLANYGGDTQTHALLFDSPAIDAGTNTGCPATDQRGTARPIDGDGDSTATCDIGALEYNFEKVLIFLPVALKN